MDASFTFLGPCVYVEASVDRGQEVREEPREVGEIRERWGGYHMQYGS